LGRYQRKTTTTVDGTTVKMESNFFIELFNVLLPIIVFFGIWIILAKKMGKMSGVKEATDSNLELAKSNLELAKAVNRVADTLEKRTDNNAN